jgi:predicted RND superfamily exporter protein
MPVLIFTTDHRAETISGIIDAVKRFSAKNRDAPVHFALAAGNVGVMAAANEVVRAKDKPIVFWVYASIIFFVWLSFRSGISIVCIILPLALTSLLTYAFMATAGIGLKVATLPVVALGAGIGVDDGIYLFSVLGDRLRQGVPLRQAWFRTLQLTGKASIFTSIALSISVSTWLFSGLQFQADMGLLLLFMFVVNMFGAIVMLPALACLLESFARRAAA